MLIVLPAIVLAGVGFYSLKQDRAMAEHEVREQTREVAEELAASILPAALDEIAAGLGFFRPSTDKHELTLSAFADDAAMLACEIDEENGLVYPPRCDSEFAHSPMDFGGLTGGQRDLWEKATAAGLIRRQAEDSVKLFDEFIASDPPRRFAAVANARAGAALIRMGWRDEGRLAFETIVRDFPDELGETGVQLGRLARLHLLRIAVEDYEAFDAEARIREFAATLSRDAVENPSLQTDWILNEVRFAELDSSDLRGIPFDGSERDRAKHSLQWRKYWELHQDARRFYEMHQDAMADREDRAGAIWLEFTPGNYWLARSIKGGGMEGTRWLIAQPASSVKDALNAAVARYRGGGEFLIGVDAVGRTIRPISLMAEDSVLVHAHSEADFGLSVKAALADPAAFYARQRSRSVRFGALIGFSALAVLIGFIAAWRSFQKQIQLSELKSNFVSSVSHELRTPIAAVSLMAEELRDIGSADPEQSREYHEFIVKECRRLTSLIENVLDYSRIERGARSYDFEPTDLTLLMEHTVKSLEAYALDHGVRLETQTSGIPAVVRTDARAIQGALVNLIDNAIKHSPRDSTVIVELKFEPTDARLLVIDHGRGIPPEDHRRIFERFFRCGSELHRETKGTGLGLAIVKHTVDAHGGRVEVRSKPGVGSCFEIVLPAGQPENQLTQNQT